MPSSAGGSIAIAAIGGNRRLVLHGEDFRSKSSTPSRAASALDILLGSLLLVCGDSRRSTAKPSKEGVSAAELAQPGRGDAWLLAVAVGAIMLSYVLSLAAASEILKANASDLMTPLRISIFSCSIPPPSPLRLVVAVAGARACCRDTRRLEGVAARSSRIVGAVCRWSWRPFGSLRVISDLVLRRLDYGEKDAMGEVENRRLWCLDFVVQRLEIGYVVLIGLPDETGQVESTVVPGDRGERIPPVRATLRVKVREHFVKAMASGQLVTVVLFLNRRSSPLDDQEGRGRPYLEVIRERIA